MTIQFRRPVIAVLMGVSGCGKTTVAAFLSAQMHWRFQEGDDLHPPANIEKMRQGTPLSDADRMPWLRNIAAVIDDWRTHSQSGTVTCSALKRCYRQIVIGERKNVALIYLRGPHDLIVQRLAARHEHFMPIALLDSQFADLDEPAPDVGAIVIEIGPSPEAIASTILRRLVEREKV